MQCRFQHPHSGYSESRSLSSVLGRNLEAPKASWVGRADRASVCHSLGAGKFCLGLGTSLPRPTSAFPLCSKPSLVPDSQSLCGFLGSPGSWRPPQACLLSCSWHFSWLGVVFLGWESFQTPGEPYTGEDYLAINGAGISTQAGCPQGCSNSESTLPSTLPHTHKCLQLTPH